MASNACWAWKSVHGHTPPLDSTSAFPNYTTRGQNRTKNRVLHGSLPDPFCTVGLDSKHSEQCNCDCTFHEAFWTELQASFCNSTSEFSTVFQAAQQGSRDTVHLVECLPGTQGALDSIPIDQMWWYTLLHQHWGGRGRRVVSSSLS